MNATSLIARINELEAEMTAEWGVQAQQQIEQEQERTLAAREQQLPMHGLRRWFPFFTEHRKDKQC